MLHKSDWTVLVIYQKTTILHFPIESIIKRDSASSAWFPTHSYRISVIMQQPLTPQISIS